MGHIRRKHVLEYRFKPGVTEMPNPWRTWGKYKTEARRQQAMDALQGKDCYGEKYYEYRKKSRPRR